jgi:hypothetical protein
MHVLGVVQRNPGRNAFAALMQADELVNRQRSARYFTAFDLLSGCLICGNIQKDQTLASKCHCSRKLNNVSTP